MNVKKLSRLIAAIRYPTKKEHDKKKQNFVTFESRHFLRYQIIIPRNRKCMENIKKTYTASNLFSDAKWMPEIK
jgi:predicted transcriptional regulator